VTGQADAGIYEFRMPSLGADMENGTLLEWRVAPGDTVRRGDIVALVDTEKAEVEVEIFAAGTIEELIVVPGHEVPVGALLARVRTGAASAVPAARPALAPPVTAAGARAAAEPPPMPAVTAPPAPRVAPAPAQPAIPPTAAVTSPAILAVAARTAAGARRERAPASPSARRRARELGVDLATLTGTGPSGGITRADVEAAAARASGSVRTAQAPPTPLVGRAPVAGRAAKAGLRRALAAAMERSNREIPHYYLSSEVDLARARAWLDETNARVPIAERVLPAVLFLKAIALAAREVPEMNGWWMEGGFRPGDGIHLGIAISRREGEVIVPALHEVDAMSLTEAMAALRDLVRRARAGTLRSSELAGATLTVTNLGELGVGAVFGVIYPPQVALVGIGRIVDRPRAIDGMLAVRPTAILSLAADHRASDGYRGARFLAAIDALLQKPEAL
jgi:pyruvate dehydrogenase E2 component (dihydrolipoamide acetyltransferase)